MLDFNVNYNNIHFWLFGTSDTRSKSINTIKACFGILLFRWGVLAIIKLLAITYYLFMLHLYFSLFLYSEILKHAQFLLFYYKNTIPSPSLTLAVLIFTLPSRYVCISRKYIISLPPLQRLTGYHFILDYCSFRKFLRHEWSNREELPVDIQRVDWWAVFRP